MNNNEELIEEDYYYEAMREQSYIEEEKYRQMMNEWWQWECKQKEAEEQKRLPAIIQIVVPKSQENEQSNI